MDWKIFRSPESLSTNLDAKAAAMVGAPEGAVYTCDVQREGRGRQGRRWISEKGDTLCFSIVLRPSCEISEIATLPLMIGLAVAEALDSYLPTSPAMVKWPNDLLVGGKKICGVLCELQSKQGRPDFVIAGIGVNVNSDIALFDDEIKDRATSLFALTGKRYELNEVLGAILESVEKNYERWIAGGYPAISKAIDARSYLMGRRVEIALMNEPVSGIVRGIAPDGALLVERNDGEIEAVYSGEAHIKS